MPAKKQKTSDFRYSTGPAAVPWAAVGESVNTGDIIRLIEFLVKPQEGRKADYRTAMKGVKRSLEALGEVGGPATKLSLGSEVKALESEACEFLRAKHACFVTNATAGFEMAYKFGGLRPGDEVICPANTFIATICYPLMIGAKVVFADVDPRTQNMDPADVARKVTPKTRVIIPVHIGGWPVHMAPIMELAKDRGITVIEDAAHAFGAVYRGKMIGTVGHFGSFSFHEVKNITSFGEGGIVVTNTRHGEQFNQARFLGLDLSKQIKTWLYDVVPLDSSTGPQVPGNHSSTEVQAVGLRAQMKRLPKIIAERRKAAQYLNERLAKVPGVITPHMNTKQVQGTYHLYLLNVDPNVLGADVQVFKKKLTERGVTQIPHFAPLYKFDLLRQLCYDEEAIAATCPNAEHTFYHTFTHLPLYPLTKRQLKTMADAVTEAAQEMKEGK